MKKMKQAELIDQQILILRRKRDVELTALKKQYKIVTESAKPSNIIKQSISEVFHSSIDKEILIKALISFVGGYATKKIFVGNSNSSTKEIVGNVIQYSISTLLNNYTKKNEQND